ncbi:MFS transporter [Desulfotalea psychrophila]|uniref:MFS transporter n=1 Tax=Desulfotalea psychrophila (strain LSv54 / DSM 12343) TaxID=177439 RepID=Q6AS55_DESPS|nr:MFS transporter [Desulfotalea psychrophila]CAG34820.1 hypothetical protein DP0091 [Desulfotalea psychrophila LSv54]
MTNQEENINAPSPFSLRNVRLFIAFRVFFNARFYYPVFTILFLDYGLTIEQFALLNTVWAVTIFFSEVPSGALADIIGRKKLLLLTSCLMIVELSLIAFVPLGNSKLIFAAFLLNRVLSGLAEAMASGADEALTYDTLMQKGLAGKWPKVLSVQMRFRAVAVMISVTLGSIVYDSHAMNRILHFLGSSISLTQETTMRFPIYLTLILGFLAFATVCMMEEPQETATEEPLCIKQAFYKTMQAGKWIMACPFALAIIMIAMCYDHSLRMIVTMTSQYFRVVGLPDASFGIIGAAMAVLGLITPRIAEHMVISYSAKKNIAITGAIALLGLFGLTSFSIFYGLLAVALVFTGLTFTSFFTSHYLNSITPSEMRATVLSFKGMMFNLSYALIGIFFAALMKAQESKIISNQPHLGKQMVENLAFRDSIGYFAPYLLILMLIGFIFFRQGLGNKPKIYKNNF